MPRRPSVLLVGGRDRALEAIFEEAGLAVEFDGEGGRSATSAPSLVALFSDSAPLSLGDAARRHPGCELLVVAPAERIVEAQAAARALAAELVVLPAEHRRTFDIVRRAIARRLRRERHSDLVRRVRAVDPELAREVEALAQEGEESGRSLDEAVRLRSSFIANISHEIRTPITVMQGMLDILADDLRETLAADQLDLLERVRTSGQSLLELLQGLLDLSKAEAGVLEARPIPLRFADLMADIAHCAEALIRNKPVRLTLDIPREIEWITVDGLRLRQVLGSLVSNAAKFTERGEIRLDARLIGEATAPAPGDPATLLRTPVPAGDVLEIVVSDTGSGISPADQGLIFEAFRQVDISSTRRHEGIGVGLTIVRELAPLLAASIRLESRLGEGTRFTIRLPVARLEQPKGLARSPRPTLPTASRAEPEARDVVSDLASFFRAPVGSVADAVAFALDFLQRRLHPEAIFFAEPRAEGWRVTEALGGRTAPAVGGRPPLDSEALGALVNRRRAFRHEAWSIVGLRQNADELRGAIAVHRPHALEADGALSILQIAARWLELELDRDRLARERRELLAALGRDVKSPLGSLLGYTQTLLRGLRGALTADQRAVVLRLERSLHGAILSTLDLLDYDRATARGLVGTKRPFPLDRVVNHVIDRHGAAVELGCHTVEVSIAAELPECAADEIRCDRSISNLLRAIMERLPAGADLRFSGSASDGFVVCEIAAAPAEPAFFFESLGDEARPLSFTDSLGLRIARAGIAAQGGRIELVRHAPNLVFRIWLPAATGGQFNK